MRPYLTAELGATSVGVVGTCWGSYLALHASAADPGLVRAAFSAHAAHPKIMAQFGAGRIQGGATVEARRIGSKADRLRDQYLKYKDQSRRMPPRNSERFRPRRRWG